MNLDAVPLTPSQKEVLRILKEAEAPKSSSAIIKHATYSQRTIRYALKKLLKKGYIEKYAYLPDMRQSRYKLKIELEKQHANIKSSFQRLNK